MTEPAAEWGEKSSALPNLSTKDLLARYRWRADVARRWRDDEGYDKTWKRLRDIYRLKMLTGKSDQDAIAVAVAFATINVIEPSVAINYPRITVNAARQDEDPQSAITEAVVNYWWRHYNIQPELRRAVKDYLVYGHGFLKVGYRYSEAEQPLHPDQRAQLSSALSDQADEYAAQNPELAAGLPTDEEIGQLAPTTQTVVVEDRPFVERVSPFDIYVDPEATCIEDAAWIAQRIVRPIEEVKRDDRYKAGARRKLEADGSVKFGGDTGSKLQGVPTSASATDTTQQADMQRVTLYEFYDIKRRTVSVFAKGGDAFLLDPQPWDYPYGLPFCMLRNYDVPDQFYPIGEIEAIEPLQDELNQTRTDMVVARKLDVPKWFVRKEALDDKGLDALRSSEPGTAILIRDDTPFDQVAQPMQGNQASAQLYTQHSQTIENDIDRITGVNEYMRGELPEIRRTATEASMIQDAANARAADKLARIELFVADVARKLVQLAQTYMTGQQVVRVVGQSGAKMWVPFNATDIQGEFDFEVEAGSTQPQNDTFKRQQAMQMATSLMPFVEQGVIDPRPLVEHMLRDGYGIKNPGQFILPAPPPSAPQPSEKLVESINYKDAPPDIQRQMESQAGFQPSQIGGSSPVEQGTPSLGEDPNAGAPNDQANLQQSEPQRASQLKGQVGLNLPNGRDGTNGGGALGPGGSKR